MGRTNGEEGSGQSEEGDIHDTGQPDTGNGEGQGSDEDKTGGGPPGK